MMLKQFLLEEGSAIGAAGVYFPDLIDVPGSVAAMASVIAWGAYTIGDPLSYLNRVIRELDGDENARLREMLDVYRRFLVAQLRELPSPFAPKETSA